MKRSGFLIGSLSGIAVVANTQHVFARALAGTPLPGLPGSRGRCLVLINLQGGNDGLNCVVPHGDPAYYQARPNIAIPQAGVLGIVDRHVARDRRAAAIADENDLAPGLVSLAGVGKRPVERRLDG